MYSLYTDPNMYSISLDAIDLNYMPVSLNHGNGKLMPLWTKRNLDRRNDKYYEFKIEYSESQDELNTEMGNTICHICDIDVPTPFLKEHYESFKHKINLKIINTVLSRIKRSVDNNIIDSKKSSKLHFCAVCVTVVNKEEKESHENSIAHKNSVLIEKFLYDFCLLYTNENIESKLNGAGINEEDSKTDLKSVDDVEPKTNGNIKLTGTQESNVAVKSVDKVTKGKNKKSMKKRNKKRKSNIKDNKSKSDMITKENENTGEVNATQSTDTTEKTKNKDDVDIHKQEVAVTSGVIEELIPDEEDLNSSLEQKSDVNSISDVSEDSEYNE